MTESQFFKNEPSRKGEGEIPDLDSTAEIDRPPGPIPSDSFQSEETRLAAILSYIPFLCFVPLLNMRDNADARLHARQGVLLFLIEVVAVLFLIEPVSKFVFGAILVIAIGMALGGIYFALQGRHYKLPIIGDFAEKNKL